MGCFCNRLPKAESGNFVVGVFTYLNALQSFNTKHFVLFRNTFRFGAFSTSASWVCTQDLFSKRSLRTEGAVLLKETQGYDASQNKYMASLMAFFRRVR